MTREMKLKRMFSKIESRRPTHPRGKEAASRDPCTKKYEARPGDTGLSFSLLRKLK